MSNLPQVSDNYQVWLLGQPHLSDYLHFVKEMALDVHHMTRAQHVDAWRDANDYYGELENSEAGIADTVETRDLDENLKPLADEVIADQRFARAFDELPWRIAMVELDKLIIGHPYLNETHKERQMAQIGPKPSPEKLFRFCQPLDREEAPVKIRKAGSRHYFFSSPSSDFRFQETAVLTAGQLNGYETFGPIGACFGVMVGFGSNFLSLIQSDNRLLIHNGHHRAYALLAHGITFAPCVIQTVTRLDELKIVAGRTVNEDPGFYFAAKRPPLLKDFLDPRIRKVHRAHINTNIIEVEVEIKEMKQVRDFI
jgi:hypothetical protein